MKKILLGLIVIFLVSIPVFSTDYAPRKEDLIATRGVPGGAPVVQDKELNSPVSILVVPLEKIKTKKSKNISRDVIRQQKFIDEGYSLRAAITIDRTFHLMKMREESRKKNNIPRKASVVKGNMVTNKSRY